MDVLAITNMYPRPVQPTHGVFVEQQVLGLREIGHDVEVLVVDRVQRGMRVYFEMNPVIDEALSRRHFDIVHIMYGGVMAGRLMNRRWTQPVVVTFHGSDVFGEHLSGWTRKAIAYIGVLESHRAARKASGVVAVSKVVAGALPRSLDPQRVRVIPCGIDLRRFKPLDRAACRQQLGWASDRLHVLFPANVGDPVKRPELAAAALDQLSTSGVPCQLHHLQGVPNCDVPIWINASDVLLLTSLHEGSPTVVKEALACNVAIVSVDVGDVAELIDGIDGCHIAAADPKDLAQKLSRVAAARGRVQSRDRIGQLSHLSVARELSTFYQWLATRRG